MKRKISAIAGMLLILASAGNIYANTNSTDAGSCSFNGKEMVSSFDSNKLAVSVSEMEPIIRNRDRFKNISHMV